jgi:hypothetical protein
MEFPFNAMTAVLDRCGDGDDLAAFHTHSNNRNLRQVGLIDNRCGRFPTVEMDEDEPAASAPE